MAISTFTLTLTSPNLVHIINTPKPISCKPLISHLTLSKLSISYPFHAKPIPTFLRAAVSVAVAAQDAALSNVVSPEPTQDIAAAAAAAAATTVTGDDDAVNLIISVLLFIAFITLSILTIGVVYIGVTDFLQKREKDKFEKEEAEKMKKGGKKKVGVRARDGPRGFGQKIDQDFDD